MTAQVRLYNDGPDDVEVTFRDKHGHVVNTLRIAAGAGTVVATSAQLSFAPMRKPSLQEMAEANGISVEEYKRSIGYREPTRYAEGD